MKQLLLICRRKKRSVFMTHTWRLIRTSWLKREAKKNIHQPEPETNRKSISLEPLSVEFNALHTAGVAHYFHFGTFSLLAKLVQVFSSLRLSYRKGRENCFGWPTTFAECNIVWWADCLLASRLWNGNSFYSGGLISISEIGKKKFKDKKIF